ncbi:MAG: hypothetical protein HY898_07810 [Deltaproteobacteria bacterium]|nr:hypothetical protein [Deltaproteobacteria bacterium]
MTSVGLDDAAGKGADEAEREEIAAKIAADLASIRKNLPTSIGEAWQHIAQGLSRAVNGCAYVRKANQRCAADFDRDGTPTARSIAQTYRKHAEDCGTVEVICHALHGALRKGLILPAYLDPYPTLEFDEKALDLFRKWARESTRAIPPGIGTPHFNEQSRARALAHDLDLIKNGGVAAAVTARGRASGYEGRFPSTDDRRSRKDVAVWLAIELRDLATDKTVEEREASIYSRMPWGGHGLAVDRMNVAVGAAFDEPSDKTVIAAYKALGYDSRRADKLFKNENAKQNRSAGRRKRTESSR